MNEQISTCALCGGKAEKAGQTEPVDRLVFRWPDGDRIVHRDGECVFISAIYHTAAKMYAADTDALATLQAKIMELAAPYADSKLGEELVAAVTESQGSEG